ncbi:MAG TPA: hypothetical protein VK815_18105 [Candidatus Acidoferrales bacterium]|jgi:hypothetical protein|nr:hypothetical protein [Candidatus Acidoferrales bacterium]
MKQNKSITPSHPSAPTRAEFLAGMKLPADTTEAELTAILQANLGTHLPLKSAVYTALLQQAITYKQLPENEAREYLAKKFPDIKPPAHGRSLDDAADALRGQLIKIYDLAADATEADIAAAAAAAKDHITKTEAERAQQEADEAVIAKKMSVGLTREQAVNVIRRQREHDAELKRGQDERRPRLLEIIGGCRAFSLEELKQARKQARDLYPFLDSSEFTQALDEVKAARA